MFLRLLCCLILSAATLSAQSSVWKVTRGGKTLYLGGTIHVLRASDFPLPEEFDNAFNQSAKIVFETDVSQMNSPELQASLMAKGFFTNGDTLKSVVSEKAWKLAADHCRRMQLPLEQLQRMKPWLFVLTITLLELQKAGVSLEGVDLHVYKKALEAGKNTGQLETIDEQVKFITTLGAGHESDLVLKSIEDIETLPQTITSVLAAWRRGDINKIDELMLREWTTKYPAILKSLLSDRNVAWIPKLDAMLNTPEIEFVLVGAGHLPGPQGVLALLKARGCKIEQIVASPSTKSPKKR